VGCIILIGGLCVGGAIIGWILCKCLDKGVL